MVGFSVYMNEDFSLEDNLAYAELAASLGYRHAFTSLHLPEVDFARRWSEMVELSSRIKKLGISLTADISPVTMRAAGASVHDLLPFREAGIAQLRLDYGFSKAEIVAMTRNPHGLRIVINASTVSSGELIAMATSGADFAALGACHNFYPRAYTGLSAAHLASQAEALASFGLRADVFVASQRGKRGPLYEGLPTLEAHRHMAPAAAGQWLLRAAAVDKIYIGDAYADEEELRALIAIDRDVIELEIELAEGLSETELRTIFSGVHTNRLDAAEHVVRSMESRGYAQIGQAVAPHHTVERTRYSVTIDNERYKRYSGELQICLSDLPRDDRVNVVGHIAESSRGLLPLIGGGVQYRFRKRA